MRNTIARQCFEALSKMKDASETGTMVVHIEDKAVDKSGIKFFGGKRDVTCYGDAITCHSALSRFPRWASNHPF